MKKLAFLLLFAVAILIGCAFNNTNAKQDKNIYVALNGNDQNNGTKSKPFRTLKKAASEAMAGTTVYIRKGTPLC
ncbi:DUF1565 domain-containing protein [Heyndrickxia sporothermodurans]|nr:DUF1565 domain-containing protein [Heyndrickxia sporothermodurans]